MRKRTKAREYALQILYQVDLTRTDPASSLQDFWTYRQAPQEIQAFATHLVQGTLARLEEIDRMIASHADNWEIARMAVVDRNILRLGAYELLHVEDVPPKVCLNEAVELAKRFGDEESSKFVNGILDAIHKAHARPSDTARGNAPSQPPSSIGNPS
jgi:N utilization substance protein B